MSTYSPLVRRTFRISVDIETTIMALPDETSGSNREQVYFHQALVQQLLAHPQQLDQLLHSSAVDALKGAEKLLAGVDQGAEQHLLQYHNR